MGMFGKPDPEKLKAKGDAEATQRFLHETFGLTRIPGAGYQVQDAVDMTQEVRDAAAAMELVKGIRERKRFKLACVLPAQFTTCIVFGSKPPLTALTALSVADGAELISLLQKESGCKIVEFDGAWILTVG
jgi:hypothetical protein